MYGGIFGTRFYKLNFSGKVLTQEECNIILWNSFCGSVAFGCNGFLSGDRDAIFARKPIEVGGHLCNVYYIYTYKHRVTNRLNNVQKTATETY